MAAYKILYHRNGKNVTCPERHVYCWSATAPYFLNWSGQRTFCSTRLISGSEEVGFCRSA